MRSGAVVLLAMPLICACIAPAAAEVFRCTVDGKTVYSDKPCSSSAKSVAIDSGIPESQAVAAKLQADANMGHVVLGQTPMQVEQAWGSPKTRNVETGSSGRTEQWVYERPEGTSYVYFRGGVVSSFNTRFESGKAPTAEPSRTFTKGEIESQERAEKAGERRFMHAGISRDGVRLRIGAPDASYWSGDVEYWAYEPAAKDEQTLTVVRFSAYGIAIGVDRTIKR